MKDFGAANGFEVPDTIVDGEVVEAVPPRKLVQTWRMLMDPTTAAEPFTTLTYEIARRRAGRLQADRHPRAGRRSGGGRDGGRRRRQPARGGGWAWILSDLKTLIETGSILAG